MPFTKLDAGIVDSSMWDAPDHVVKVWVTILAKKDHNGIVKSTFSALQRASNLYKDFDGIKFREAINVLESPDLESRTKGNEGRRIEKIEGGWKVINHKKYRDYSYSTSPSALKQKRYRERKKNSNALPSLRFDGNADGNASVSVSVSVSVSEEEEREKEMSEFETFRLIYPGQKRSKETEFNSFKSKYPEYRKILPILVESIKKQIETKRKLLMQKKFFPSWKSLENYLAKRGWEEEFEIIQPKQIIPESKKTVEPTEKMTATELEEFLKNTVEWKYLTQEQRDIKIREMTKI